MDGFVGLCVGVFVGVFVNTRVGDLVGVVLGLLVDARLGACVGAWMGCRSGCRIGDEVGSAPEKSTEPWWAHGSEQGSVSESDWMGPRVGAFTCALRGAFARRFRGAPSWATEWE